MTRKISNQYNDNIFYSRVECSRTKRNRCTNIYDAKENYKEGLQKIKTMLLIFNHEAKKQRPVNIEHSRKYQY